jgi:hypothetical protein
MGARRSALPIAALFLLLAAGAAAQEMEPRSYIPGPAGLNVVILTYGYSQGGVFTDPSLPISDVTARINSSVAMYARTFDLFGRAASFNALVPGVWGSVEGDVGEEHRRVTRSGFADPRLRCVVNLLGGPAMTREEFRARGLRTTLGLGVTAVLPLGEYFPDKLINLGSNRWAGKAELGFLQPFGRWMVEAYAGVWVFGDNDDFFGGHHRSQDPIGALQAHLSYNITTRLWAAFDVTHYRGGRTALDGASKNDLQSNDRVGLTVSMPVGKRYSVRVACSTGVSTLAGQDFDTCMVGGQVSWFD